MSNISFVVRVECRLPSFLCAGPETGSPLYVFLISFFLLARRLFLLPFYKQRNQDINR